MSELFKEAADEVASFFAAIDAIFASGEDLASRFNAVKALDAVDHTLFDDPASALLAQLPETAMRGLQDALFCHYSKVDIAASLVLFKRQAEQGQAISALAEVGEEEVN
jgi:uncharacterized protein (DUF1810 family)